MSGRSVFAFAAASFACLGGCEAKGPRPINFGVPTTVQDSGLLDSLKVEFEKANAGYRLRVVSGGSGELLELGARGDVDVLLSHSPAAEAEFMEAGHGLLRRPVMENDFVIVGPPHDPAGIRGLSDASAALARIAAVGAPFLSRADDSGTHRRELELWVASTERGAGYRELGQGMADVLTASSELQAYALCDRATYTSLREVLEPAIMVEGDERLRNIYSVIVPARGRDRAGGHAFADWVASADGHDVIGRYGVERFGEQLFKPIAPSTS